MSSICLNTGAKIPILGLGTWKSAPEKVFQAVKAAIDCGYRHIDCAYLYGNEDKVGEAIESKIQEGIVKREDLFVTTKLWSTFHKPEDVEEAFNDSLRLLNLNYVDLYLMHSPVAYKNVGKTVFHPVDGNGKILHDNSVDYLDTWLAMEKLLQNDRVRSIGVSNFNQYQLKRVIDKGNVVPAVNQVECHPYQTQDDMLTFCQKSGIAFVGYSPFGSPDRFWASPDEPRLLNDPTILEIAQRMNKTAAQVLLRFSVQRNIVVLPKSVTPSRIMSNSKIFDFILTECDMESISKLNRNWRALLLHWDVDNIYYPFQLDYSEQHT